MKKKPKVIYYFSRERSAVKLAELRDGMLVISPLKADDRLENHLKTIIGFARLMKK